MKDLIQKISKVMKELGAVGKDGKNDFHGYAYRSHAGLMKALHPLLCRYELVIYLADVEITAPTIGHVITKQKYGITDGTDHLYIYGVGEGDDISKGGKAGDKAAYKAQTGGHKYMLNALFTIPDELDPETDSQTHDDDIEDLSTGNGSMQLCTKSQKTTIGNYWDTVATPDTLRWLQNETKTKLEYPVVLEKLTKGKADILIAGLKKKAGE